MNNIIMIKNKQALNNNKGINYQFSLKKMKN